MTRTGLVVALVLGLAVVAIASMVRVTGPGAHRDEVAETAAPAATGPLMMPVPGVARSALVDSWNDPRGDGTRQHHAIDIPAAEGAAVVAVADGRIEKLFASTLGGQTIYQRSPDGGTVYYYAHLSRYAPTLAEGQAVRAGQTIAAVGATGNADPGAPHLHFEVHRMAPGDRWWQGREVDPYPLLKAGA